MHITHFIANADIQTAYNECGSGHALVLVHGFTGSKLDFADRLAALADLRRVIAYDHRGHGESSNHGPYSLDKLADDLIGLLDRLHIDRCDLLGHSLGGMVALRAVLANPARFSSLILMDTSAKPLRLRSKEDRRRLDALVDASGCEALLDAMRRIPPGPAEQRGIDLLGASEHWRRIHTKLSQMDPDAFRALGAEIADGDDLLARLGEIDCPTTVIVGEHDRPFLEPSRALAAGIPEATLVAIADAAHCPQYENAQGWLLALRRHLTVTAAAHVD